MIQNCCIVIEGDRFRPKVTSVSLISAPQGHIYLLKALMSYQLQTNYTIYKFSVPCLLDLHGEK